MGRLMVVRHGQASFQNENYDQLSRLGREQARALGHYWAGLDYLLDRVYVGPRQRHRQTMDEVAAVYRDQGMAFPEAEEWPEFDEHQGPSVVRQVINREELEPGEALARLKNGGREIVREYFKKYQKITRQWVEGDLDSPGHESWDEFRRRVERGLARILAESDKSSRIAVFSSGGPVAASAGHALGLDNHAVLELSWYVHNGATAEFLFSGTRFTQISFNALPHLPHVHQHTLV